jgi:hypothetical protein
MLASLDALYAGYGDDDDDAFDEDNAFGDAFTAVLARVPQFMGAVVAWARARQGGGGGGADNDSSNAAAAEALEALSAHPLLPDDVLGGERWLDLCSALPVCLFSGDEDDSASAAVATAAARLLRFLSPALLAGSGGCADALATVLIPLLNYMAKAGLSLLFSVRRHAEAAAEAVSAPASSSSAETPDALAMQFALVGLDRLGRQWHLLDPGLGPGLARGVCALLAAPLSLSSVPAADGAATAAQALLAWEPDAAWWHRLCAVTAPSLDVSVAAVGGGAGTEEASAPPLLPALVRRRWESSSSTNNADPSLEAVAVHALVGVLGAPALRRVLLEEEERRGGGDAGEAGETPLPPLWDALLQASSNAPPPQAVSAAAYEQGMADAARAAARAVVARLAGPEVPPPVPPPAWVERAAAAAVARR